MARALKVFRTPVGFHDAYVAAASQKAALAAWGSDANLFARGVAEVVTDPALTAEPLANPGQIVKRLRGTAEDHFHALPKAKAKPKPAAPARPKAQRAAPPPRPRKAVPRPSRADLDAAEQALAALDGPQREAQADLRAREEALRRERQALDRAQATERERLTGAARTAKDRYVAALTKWRDQSG